MATSILQPRTLIEAMSFGVDVDTLSGLNAALENVATENTLLIVSSAQTLDGNAVIEGGRGIFVTPGGSVASNSYSLTIAADGALSCMMNDSNLISFGSGQLIVSNGAEIPIEWFGGNLANAITAIGSGSVTLVISSDITLTGNATVLATTSLAIRSGSVTLGDYNLTINGHFEGVPDCFVQAGTGVVTFGAGATNEVHPEWWGVDGAADEIQINQAANSIQSVGGIVRLGAKTYVIAGAIKLFSFQWMVGNGHDTVISGNLASALVQEYDKSGGQFIGIKNLKIDNTSSATAGGIGIDMTGISHGVIEDVWISNVYTGIYFEYVSGGYYNDVRNPTIASTVVGIHVHGAGEQNIFGGTINTSTTAIYTTAHINVYGTGIENFSSVGIQLASGSNQCLIAGARLENASAVGIGIQIDSGASASVIVSPYMSTMDTYISDSGTYTQYVGDDEFFDDGSTLIRGWRVFTPTVAAATGTITTYTASGRYRIVGSRVFLQLRITITTKGTAAGAMTITLPAAITSANNYNIMPIPFVESSNSGKTVMGQLFGGDVLISVMMYDGTSPFVADGDAFSASAIYELKY